MPWFSFWRRRAEKFAAARRAIHGTNAEPQTRVDRDFATLWRDLDQLRNQSFPAREQARDRWTAALRRRSPYMILAGAMLFLAIGCAIPLVISLCREYIPELDARHSTAVDKQQIITLPDGSTIKLNLGSSAKVRYFHARREIVLEQGEAFFTVARDPARPLEVIAGPVRVRVLGTQFNVRIRDKRVDVAVRTGRVAAFGAGDSAGTTLTRGQQASFPAGGAHAVVASIAPDAAGAWTDGWIKLERAPLAMLVEELGRYGPGKIDLTPEAATLSVSGAFRIDDPQGALQMLPRVLPVKVVAGRDGGYFIQLASQHTSEPPRYLETPLPR